MGLPAYVYAMCFIKPNGTRKLLLVNKRDRDFEISILGSAKASIEVVDQTTAFEPLGTLQLNGDKSVLRGLGVAVVTLGK